MSTLAVATIKSISSAAPVFQNTSGVEKGQLAKVWVAFDGTGTVAIDDDFNVSSITDESTGKYTVNFDNAMSNANYCCVVGAGNNAAGSAGAWNTVYDDATTTSSSVQIALYTYQGQPQDNEQVFMVVYGAN